MNKSIKKEEVETKEQVEKLTELLGKIESINIISKLKQIKDIDGILLEVQKKQEALFKKIEEKEPVVIKEEKIKELEVKPQVVARKKKSYVQMNEKGILKALEKYPELGEKYKASMFTTTGEDLFVDLGKKKKEIKK